MLLSALLEHIEIIEVVGTTDRNVSGIEFDSRRVVANSVFVAQEGVTVDGHNYIDKA